MRATASSGLIPYGSRSVRKRPISSPAHVRSSWPTTTRQGSWPVRSRARAPLTVPWSVMHSTSTPLDRTASSSSSGVVVASPDHMVWRWRSTRTWPARRGAARWGWISAAVSAPTEADVADHEGDAGGPARQPFEVGADGGHVLEHALEGRRHRGLAHGLGQGAVVHHQALDADR